jgi:hypothetical protein
MNKPSPEEKAINAAVELAEQGDAQALDTLLDILVRHPYLIADTFTPPDTPIPKDIKVPYSISRPDPLGDDVRRRALHGLTAIARLHPEAQDRVASYLLNICREAATQFRTIIDDAFQALNNSRHWNATTRTRVIAAMIEMAHEQSGEEGHFEIGIRRHALKTLGHIQWPEPVFSRLGRLCIRANR